MFDCTGFCPALTVRSRSIPLKMSAIPHNARIKVDPQAPNRQVALFQNGQKWEANDRPVTLYRYRVQFLPR
jgi:hypothetical protein